MSKRQLGGLWALFGPASLLLPGCDANARPPVPVSSNSRPPGQVSSAQVFFIADDGVRGDELWRTDGTVPGTVIVKDIDPASTDRGMRESLTAVNGRLFLVADDGVNGAELWVSDGTEAGTRLVKDIRAGAAGSRPLYLTGVGDTLFFVADDGIHGRELWRSSGTAETTSLVHDIYPGATSSLPNGMTAMVDTTAPSSSGPRVYPLPSATATPSPYPRDLTGFGGAVIFSAFEPEHGRELWKSDGTKGGTTLLADIFPGAGSSWPAVFSVMADSLMFSTVDSSRRRGLWRSNGQPGGTLLVYAGSWSDLDPPYGGPMDLTAVGQSLFFTADFNASLWRSDGRPDGTIELMPLQARDLTGVNGELFFFAYERQRQTLWRSNGTPAGTRPVSEAGGCGLTPMKGQLFFMSPCLSGTEGELWRSDGTAGTTVRVRGGWTAIGPLRALESHLIFAAADPERGSELWTSDGTEARTVLLKDVRPGPADSHPREFTVVRP